MIEETYTRKQIAGIKHKNIASIARVLVFCKTAPNGLYKGRWPAYTMEAFDEAEKKYNEAMVAGLIKDIDDDKKQVGDKIDDADLRTKLARAEMLEIEIKEHKGLLVEKTKVDRMYQFLLHLFVKKIKELTKQSGDEFYNLIVEELYKDIESYVSEENIDKIITDKDIDTTAKIMENPS